jgi:hypothetical protein
MKKRLTINKIFSLFFVILCFVLTSKQSSAQKIDAIDMAGLGAWKEPLVFLPDNYFSQVNTLLFTINVYQLHDFEDDAQLINSHSFIKLTNASYFSSLGAFNLGGISYHVYKYISTDYTISQGFFGYINISETYGNLGINSFGIVRSNCQNNNPYCGSRLAYIAVYKYFANDYLSSLPFSELDQTSKNDVAALFNTYYGYSGNGPSANDWEDVLNADKLSEIKLPTSFNCNSTSICSCFSELKDVIKNISNYASDPQDKNTVFDGLNHLFQLNALTECNCFSKYFTLNNAYKPGRIIFAPKEANYPLFAITDTNGFNVFLLDSLGDFVPYGDIMPDINNCGNGTNYPGDSISLCASGIAPLLWSTGDTTRNIIVTPDSTTNYYLYAVNPFGCEDTSMIEVKIKPFKIEAGKNDTICVGDTAHLQADGAVRYLWNTSDTTASIAVFPDSTTYYVVTGYSQSGASATDTVMVYINRDIPTAEAGPNDSICKGTNIELTASGGNKYLWSTIKTDATITVTPDSTTMYYVTVSNGCNAAKDSVTIKVLPSPVADAGLNDTICPGGIASLSATGGISYIWSNGKTTQSISPEPTETTSFYVTVTSENSCTASTSVAVVMRTPATLDIGENHNICSGQTDTLRATEGFHHYLWNSGDTTAVAVISPSNNTIYNVKATDYFGCVVSDTVSVNVSNYAIAEAGNDITACKGINDTLRASGGDKYLWSTNETTATIVVSPDSSQIYFVTVSNNGCAGKDSVQVNINPLPVANAGPDNSICFGLSDTLSASGGIAYKWSNGDSIASIIVHPRQTTTYTISVTDDNHCMATDAATITVYPEIRADGGFNKSIALGDTTTLTASGGAQYHWSTNENVATISVSPTVSSVYIVTVTDEYGCTAANDVTVLVGTTELPYPETYWQKNDSTIVTIAGVGNVGIGTGTPTERLSVFGNISTTGKLNTSRITSSDTIVYVGNSCIAIDGNNDRIYSVHFPFNPNGSGNLQNKDPWIFDSEGPPINGQITYRGFGIGKYANGLGRDALAIGYYTYAYKPLSFSFGSFLKNNVANSFMIGFNNTSTLIPTFFVGPSDVTGTGRVAIGTSTPIQKFQVDGGDMLVRGNNNFANSNDEAVLYLGDPYHYIKSINGTGLRIGTFPGIDAISIQQVTGNVGIGTSNTTVGGTSYKLAIDGKIVAREITITLTGWNDFVFDKKYNLMPLTKLEKFINEHKHLPEIPSENEVINNGVPLGETQSLLLKKIEELTLYIIEINKRVKRLEVENSILKKESKSY